MPYVVEQVEDNRSHCISNPPSNFRQMVACTQHLWYIPKRRSCGVRSGEPGGQVRGPLLPIHFFGNVRFKKRVTTSCWNSMSSGPSPSKTHMKNSSTWDATVTSVSVPLQVGRFVHSSGTNYKLYRITYSNAFSYHSSAFRFMSNVAVKWYKYHMYSLYHSKLYPIYDGPIYDNPY
jgi:hypothetical protein